MKELTFFTVLMIAMGMGLNFFGKLDDLQNTAHSVHNYEYKNLKLSKNNRILRKQNTDLKYEIAKLKASNEHLEMSLSNKKRTIASVRPQNSNDLVNFELFKWSASKLLGVGKQSLHFKKYEKSAQYYNALLKHYPSNRLIDDKILFEAGVAAYESKKHYRWAIRSFDRLVKKFPKSKLYRGAKLWYALANYHQGNKQEFMVTVDEFKKKYRNTKEWKILSKYYENLAYEHNKRDI